MNHKDDYYIHLSNMLKNTDFQEALPSISLLYNVFSLKESIEDMTFFQNIMGLNVNTNCFKQNKTPVYIPNTKDQIFIQYIFEEKEIHTDNILYIYLGKESINTSAPIIRRSSPSFYNELEKAVLSKALKTIGLSKENEQEILYIHQYLSNMVGFQWSFDQSPYHLELEKEIGLFEKKFDSSNKELLQKYNSLFYKNYPRNKEINDFNKKEFSKAYFIVKELLEEEMSSLEEGRDLLHLNKEGKVIVSDILFKNNDSWEKLHFNIKEKNKKIRSDEDYFYLHYLYSVLKEKSSSTGATVNFEGFKEKENELELDISFSEYRTTISHSNYYLYLLTNSIPPKKDYTDPLSKIQIKNWIKERTFFKQWKKDLKMFLSALENKETSSSYFSMGISFALLFKEKDNYVVLIRQQRKHANVIEGYNVMPSTIFQTGSSFYEKLKNQKLSKEDLPLLLEDLKIDHFLIRELIREIFLGGGVRDFSYNIPSYHTTLPASAKENLSPKDYSDYKVKDLHIYHRLVNSIDQSLPLNIIGIALDPLRLRPEIMVMVPIEYETILEDLKKFEFDTKADFINLNERDIRYLALEMEKDFEKSLIQNELPGKEGAKHYSGTGIRTIEKSFNLLKNKGGNHEQ